MEYSSLYILARRRWYLTIMRCFWLLRALNDSKSFANCFSSVVRECELEPPSQKHIRYMYNNGLNALIICFTDKMAQQLVQRDSLELDISFKRVAAPL